MANKRHRVIITGTYVDNISKGIKKTVALMKSAFTGVFRLIKSGFKAIGKAAKAAFSFIRTGAKYATIALGVYTAAVAYALKQYGVQQKAEKQIAGILKTRGIYTKEVATQIFRQASAIQKVTGIGDEYTMQLMRILLTSQELGIKMLPRVTMAVLDMAAALGMDANAAALLMQKALDGQVSSLSRYGIIVDKAAVKTRGFAAVLDAVEAKFKGQAKIIRTTLPGAWDALIAEIGDVWEKVGQMFAPTAMPGMEWIIAQFQKLNDYLATANLGERVREALSDFYEANIRGAFDFEKTIRNVTWLWGQVKNVVTDIWDSAGNVDWAGNIADALDFIFEKINKAFDYFRSGQAREDWEWLGHIIRDNILRNLALVVGTTLHWYEVIKNKLGPILKKAFIDAFEYIKSGRLKGDWESFARQVKAIVPDFLTIAEAVKTIAAAWKGIADFSTAYYRMKQGQAPPGSKRAFVHEVFNPPGSTMKSIPEIYRGGRDYLGSVADNFSRFNEAGRQRTNAPAAPTAAERFERAVLTFSPTVHVDARGNDDAEKLAREIAEEFGRMWFAGEHDALGWLHRAMATTGPTGSV